MPQRSVPTLTKFQLDLLYVIADIGPTKGLAIKEAVGEYYDEEINHGRLYPNLDELVDRGLVEKGKQDERTNSYGLTQRGRQVLEKRHQWEADRLDGVSV